MDETPAYRVPEPPHRAASRLWIVIIAVAILLTVVGLAAAAYFYPPLTLPIRSAWSASMVPAELSGAQFLAETDGGTRIYAKDGAGYASEDIGGLLVSADGSGRGSVRIVKDPADTYRLNRGMEVLVKSGTSLAGASRSPDGSHIAYAEKIAAPALRLTGSSFSFGQLNTNEWMVRTIHPESGAILDIGTGAYPVFLDDRTVLRISPTGIFTFDLQTGESRTLLEQNTPQIPLAVLVSPDRTLIGVQDDATRTVAIYRVSPTSATLAATLPMTDRVMSLALGNDGLYILRTSRFGTEVWKESLDSQTLRKVMLLPENLRVSRLFINSL